MYLCDKLKNIQCRIKSFFKCNCICLCDENIIIINKKNKKIKKKNK